MANYTDLKAAIVAVIKANGNNEITGTILQSTLLSIVNSVGANATFKGVANSTTNPGTPDQNVFYIAGTPGEYANFGLTVPAGFNIISNNSAGAWVLTTVSQFPVDYYGNKYLAKGDIDRTGYNVASINDFKKGYYFNWTNYSLETNPSYWMSPYYPVVAGSTYRINAQQIIWFDANYNMLGSELALGGTVRVVTAPENAAYIILNVNTDAPLLMPGDALDISNYSGTRRFYRTLAETSRLDLFPLWQEIPLSATLVALGLNRFLINGYINMEYDPAKWYSLSIIRPTVHTIGLYRYNANPDFLAGTAELEGLATFTGAQIAGSKYWLMKVATGVAEGSWLIVDWDAIQQETPADINNLYGFDGWALTPKIFAGGIWSQFPGLDITQTIPTMQAQIANINVDWNSVFDNLQQLDNAQEWETDNFTNQNAFSTFSGWGCHIGVRKNFDAAEVCVINRGVDPITQLRVAIFDTDYDSTKLADATVYVSIAPGETKYIAVPFGQTIANADGKVLFLMYWCNQLVVRRGYNGTYPYLPDNGYQFDRYSTDGNMTETYAVTNGGFPFYFRVGIIKDNYVLNDDQIADIASRIGVTPPDPVNISLPDTINAIVGDTLQLFFRGMIQAVDPYKYDILVTCSKGNKYPRYFQYTPTVADVGTTTFTVTVKDDDRNVLASKTCQLVTRNVVQSPAANLNVACFGDSLTATGTWCAEANRRLTGTGGTPAGKALTNIAFVGSKQNGTTGYFGVGGWTWESYTQQGRPAYRFQVTGVTSLSVGAVYTNNGNTFTVMEVNVTGGTGNILCSVTALTPAPSASGTLTKSSGTGDATITYTSVARDTQNPLWDWDNNKMSFIPYANAVAGGKIDVVYTLLSWNEQTPGRTDFTSVLNQIKIFADTLHAEFPNAKLKIMGVQVPSVRGGMDANYGATGTSYADGYGMVVTALNQNDAYQEFANRPEYSGFVEFVNVSAEFDTEYNMPHAERAVNTRNAEVTEWVDTNGVHPDNNGYLSIGDVCYRNFVANFCQ